MPGEHVHFVNQINLETPVGRRVLNVIQQLAHIVDAGTRSRIDLDQVNAAAGIDLDARSTFAARFSADALFAIERFGEYPRYRGLADTPGPAEQVGVMQSIAVQRIDQRLNHVLLPHHLFEVGRTPFTR